MSYLPLVGAVDVWMDDVRYEITAEVSRPIPKSLNEPSYPPEIISIQVRRPSSGYDDNDIPKISTILDAFPDVEDQLIASALDSLWPSD